jgi:hypothetical protein
MPCWPGVIHSNKGRTHLRRPTRDITLRVRQSGGPYILDEPQMVRHLTDGSTIQLSGHYKVFSHNRTERRCRLQRRSSSQAQGSGNHEGPCRNDPILEFVRDPSFFIWDLSHVVQEYEIADSWANGAQALPALALAFGCPSLSAGVACFSP